MAHTGNMERALKRPASDIMFTKPLHSAFFNAGQVIETVRGGGIFQPAVDKATKLLQSGEWVSGKLVRQRTDERYIYFLKDE